MRRRDLLKGLLAGLAGSSAFRLPLANAADYGGRFFVFVQADGGWDPTSFCDPKVNQKGEDPINHWAEGLVQDDVPEAGNIRYAPFANNKRFFDDHHDKMLVINGVDAQTNSHSAGIVHNWSGRVSEGYPTLTALLAARYAPDWTVPYLSFGGFSFTSGVSRFTRLDNPERFRGIVAPEVGSLRQADWVNLAKYRAETMSRLMAVPNVLPMDERNRSFYLSALSREGLRDYADAIPTGKELKDGVEYESPSGHIFDSTLEQQAQLTVLAFKTGVAVSADMFLRGFDTHTAHDDDHSLLLGALSDGVDYLWRYGEQHGVANRMVVVIGSDFGRTNHYNSDKGKDHWPYGSYVIMEKNQPWTNRVVGETDELHEAYNIDPATLERLGENDPNGTHIYPKHVHKALRRYLGIEKFAAQKGFPFNNTEDFAFFG